MSKITYPCGNTLIAPGMAATFHVNFYASSHSDFDDEMKIVTEESAFVLKLLARREHPVLTLPQNLDCQSCWLGDKSDMVF